MGGNLKRLIGCFVFAMIFLLLFGCATNTQSNNPSPPQNYSESNSINTSASENYSPPLPNFDSADIFVAEAHVGNTSMVALFIKMGANVNKTNYLGRSALMVAALGDHIDIVKMLVAAGADVNARNKVAEPELGRTPLIYAVSGGDIEIVKYLVAHGADVNGKDDDQSTPITYAAYDGDLEIVKFLVQSGADVSAKDKLGYTALDYSNMPAHGSPQVSDYLRQQMNKST
jgi:ankyrin repeat protein